MRKVISGTGALGEFTEHLCLKCGRRVRFEGGETSVITPGLGGGLR